jgi:hypothetical protein
MKIKQIEITFNDNTKQSDIDYQAARIAELLEAQGITAVILVHEVDDILEIDFNTAQDNIQKAATELDHIGYLVDTLKSKLTTELLHEPLTDEQRKNLENQDLYEHG